MKKPKFKFTVANRISLGYIVVIAVAIITSTICILSLQSNKIIDKEISSVHLPIMDAAKELRYTIAESRKLTNNWIYMPSVQEKKSLSDLINAKYPLIKDRIIQILSDAMVDDSTRSFIKNNLATFDDVLVAENKVMGYLNNDDAYGSDSLIDLAITSFDSEIKNKALGLETGIENFILKENNFLKDMQQSKEKSYSILSYMMAITVILILVVSIGASYYSTISITKPLLELSTVIQNLGKGEISVLNHQLTKRSDEIGDMSQAIDTMINGLVSKAEFADEIGKGNYEKEFALLSDKDKMGFALIEMRNNLKKNGEEERKRNWATTGLAQIGDILRKTDLSADVLYNNIISFIVKYVNANQGGLFIINDHIENDTYLELVACYAYEKKKFIEKRVNFGEGLIGQAAIERDIIFMTDVPDDYVNITSGIGSANPSCILIVPLKINDVVHGVIELAAFHTMEAYEIGFIEKLAESIAATIATVKINERTRKLLEDSQVQGEQLRSQEEEMRQNMEELQATQEEVQRKEQSYIDEINVLKQKLAIYSDNK